MRISNIVNSKEIKERVVHEVMNERTIAMRPVFLLL